MDNSITTFLEARIAEDEQQATKHQESASRHGWGDYPTHVIAECAAKRSIVQYVVAARADRGRDAEADAAYRAAWWVATRLASVYKTHPDYQQEWPSE